MNMFNKKILFLSLIFSSFEALASHKPVPPVPSKTPQEIANRPLSKLASGRGFVGEPDHRTAVYVKVHEDSRTASTPKSSAEVEFPKRSNEERLGSSPTEEKNLPPQFQPRETRPLVNGAFGMGKNFYSYRAGYAFSPMKMPKNWEKWDFYLEFAFYILHRKVYSPKQLYIGSITPFLRYHFPVSDYDPYWDIGLGGAYRDKKKFGNINISTNFCFHILTGLGFHPFGSEGPSLSARWYHFSNAKIKLPNNGIDINFNIALEQKF